MDAAARRVAGVVGALVAVVAVERGARDARPRPVTGRGAVADVAVVTGGPGGRRGAQGTVLRVPGAVLLLVAGARGFPAKGRGRGVGEKAESVRVAVPECARGSTPQVEASGNSQEAPRAIARSARTAPGIAAASAPKAKRLSAERREISPDASSRARASR